MIPTISPKKADFVSLLVIAVVIGAAYSAIFHRGITRYLYLKTQERVLGESLESTTAIDQKLQGFRDEIQAVQIQLNEFNRRLPKEKTSTKS
jgi:Tfp pilus assembly protein PilO